MNIPVAVKWILIALLVAVIYAFLLPTPVHG